MFLICFVGQVACHTGLNAATYGVPRKRERVIIVGFRNDLDIDFDFPSAVITDEEKYVPLRSVVDGLVDSKYFFSEKVVAGMMKNRESMNKGQGAEHE